VDRLVERDGDPPVADAGPGEAALHTLPYDEPMARLDRLTNVRVVEDPAAPTGYKLDIAPFPGWKDVPTW
jgi:hypothetical protein